MNYFNDSLIGISYYKNNKKNHNYEVYAFIYKYRIG